MTELFPTYTIWKALAFLIFEPCAQLSEAQILGITHTITFTSIDRFNAGDYEGQTLLLDAVEAIDLNNTTAASQAASVARDHLHTRM